MNKIILDNVVLHLTDDAKDKIYREVDDGSIYEYLSMLINQDCSGKSSDYSSNNTTLEDIALMLKELQSTGVKTVVPQVNSNKVDIKPREVEIRAPKEVAGDLGGILNKFKSLGRK